MKSNRSLQGRLTRHRLALPPQRPPPQDPFQAPTSPDLSLVLEDDVEVIGPFIPPGRARPHKKDDIHAFYRSIETNEIPKEHVDEFYIPLLTRSFTPTDEIAREASEWINERVKHAKERGVKMVNPMTTYHRIMNNVAETYNERIKRIEKEQEQALKRKIQIIGNIENNINDIIDEINTTIQECIKEDKKEEDCLELKELKSMKAELERNKERIVKSIRLTYDRR